MNGSVSVDPPGVWTAAIDLDLEGQRVKVTARAGKQRYDTEALVQMEGCTVRGTGVVESQRGLRGSLAYHNNCSVLQVNNHLVLMATVAPFLS